MQTYIVQSTAHQEREDGWIATRQIPTVEVQARGPSAALVEASAVLPKGWHHSVTIYCPATDFYQTAFIAATGGAVWTGILHDSGPAKNQCECGAFYCTADHDAEAAARIFDPLS